ncbi:chorismate mutase [Microbaculum marinum]|uniref:chorismate mutase n=1 Tax=Microbaculum marinum TaxID=1764581 RepID=A0AAW9R9Q2_9HYPH
MTDPATPPVAPGSAPAASLEALRADIDAADEQMHKLLIHRGQVIEQLIAAKKVGARSAAFRPDREADMMRRIAGRHSGQLPLSTVEHIWREIIGTFTQLQAPFSIHAAGSGTARMRDMLRFYFGFMSNLVDAPSSRAAVDAVAASGEDLAVVAFDDPLEERWWGGLPVSGDHATGSIVTGAKVIAALPFLPLDERLDFPRVFVVGPANVSGLTDIYAYAIETDTGAASDLAELPGAIASRGPRSAILVSRQAPAQFHQGTPDAICLGSFAEPMGWPD